MFDHFPIFLSLGILGQSLFYIQRIYKANPKDLWQIPLVVLLSLFIGMLPGRHEQTYDLTFHVGVALCVYAICFAWTFRKVIITTINEKVLLQLSLITIYTLLSFYGNTSATNLPIILFILLPATILILTSTRGEKMRPFLKLFFHLWYFSLNIILVGSYIISNQSPFKSTNSFDQPFNEFIFGMNIFFLITNIVYIYELFPIPERGTPYKEKLQQCKEFAALLASKYQATDKTPHITVIIILVQGGMLLLNYFFNLISPIYLVSISLVITNALTEFLTRRSTTIVDPQKLLLKS